jgi:hypothetical protein
VDFSLERSGEERRDFMEDSSDEDSLGDNFEG